jgi:hypothetical protein
MQAKEEKAPWGNDTKKLSTMGQNYRCPLKVKRRCPWKAVMKHGDSSRGNLKGIPIPAGDDI